jgi:molybdenum-dependent DNA-binding transcriptional regulator ModE
LLIRKRGGNDRGGASLTPYAEKYILSFKGLEEKIRSYARMEFQEFEKEIANP